jgi:L-seryl-tRNA(Ser) seleniumtransferase
MRALIERSPRSLVTDAVRAVIAEARSDARGIAALPLDDDGWVREVERRIAHRIAPSLRATINATGVVLHTNLGRAPLAAVALEAIAEVSRGASTLEYDLARGARGSRHVHCASLLAELTGAEDALVVNNCAAALVLALQAFASGRETLVSRGELVEIGGSFRVPEIMSTSGTTLVEVGTTNRTHVDDYRRALSPRTGALVKVHRSNFAQEGFVAEAPVRDLAPVAADAGVPLIHDLGSGLLLDLSPWGLTGEPTARDAVAGGATLVLMSGDKLLGGPQAGIILGRAAAVARLRQHPLARALRVDKLTLAALEATLGLYRDAAVAVREIPALAMLTALPARVRARAEAVRTTLARYGVQAHVEASEATVGGGAFPTARIPSACVVLDGDAVSLEARLRAGAIPVIGRIAEGRVLLDLRSVQESEDATLATLVRAARA